MARISTNDEDRMCGVQQSLDIRVFARAANANDAATDWLADRLLQPSVRNVMVAGGNTPLALYAQVARRGPPLGHLNIFALDEYVGVPQDESRNCANLIRHAVVEAWGIPAEQYYCLRSCAVDAAQSIIDHEQTIRRLGGLDLVVLGLGRNGHVGFNEPGSGEDSVGRVMPLSPISVEANRAWFQGDYAPSQGVTTGMRTILSARAILLLAFGAAKADAVVGMIERPPAPACPASYLQRHPDVTVFLDEEAASRLAGTHRGATTPAVRTG